MMTPVKNFLFYSCKKATELLERSKEEELSPLEKSRLSIHLSMCKSCQEYESASHQLDKHWSSMISDTSTDSDAQKKKIIQLLKQDEE